jgi:hypothetical protein
MTGGGATGGGVTGGGATGGGATGGGATGGGATGGGATGGGGALPGDTCTTAMLLPGNSGPATFSTVGYTPDYSLACTVPATNINRGPDIVFAVDVPAARMLSAVVTSLGTNDPSVMIVDATSPSTCGTAACLGGDDRGDAAQVNVARFANEGSTTARVFVIVDSYFAPSDARSTGGFTLETALSTFSPGGTCSTAQPLPMTPVNGSNGLRSYLFLGTGCATTVAEQVSVFSSVVGPGQTLTVTGTDPMGTADVVINMTLGPASQCGLPTTSCVAGVLAASPGTTSYTNSTGSMVTVFTSVALDTDVVNRTPTVNGAVQ